MSLLNSFFIDFIKRKKYNIFKEVVIMAQCIQCQNMDLCDRNKFGDAYCKDRGKYYDPYSSACSNIEYSDASLRDREREDENERNHGSSGCYLTTAMCYALGYDDHCVYLETLRRFRDEYMMNDPECYPMLVEYEVVGPMISRQIAQDADIASIMLNEFISKSIMYIKRGEFKSAIDVYRDMFDFLKARYSLENVQVDMTDVDFLQSETMNKQEIRTLAKSAKIVGRN